MHSREFLTDVASIANALPEESIEAMASALAARNGRVYIIGLGGSLANAIHMAADLRKLCEVDATAFDNIAEITARANDDGLATLYDFWLTQAKNSDILFVLSVGGGTSEVSPAIVNAVSRFPGKVFGIVGPIGGYTALNSDIVIRVPTNANMKWQTPLTEAFQAVIWHCIVSHPVLQKNKTKW